MPTPTKTQRGIRAHDEPMLGSIMAEIRECVTLRADVCRTITPSVPEARDEGSPENHYEPYKSIPYIQS